MNLVDEFLATGKDPTFFAQKEVCGIPGPEAFFHCFLQPYLRGSVSSADFHSDLFYFLTNSNRVVIAAPRAHAKSTISSFGFPLWAAVTGVKAETIIVSKALALAESWLDKIKHEIEYNEALIDVYGNLKGRLWRSDQIKLRNGCRIYAKGSGFQIRGFRPDALVLDDLEDEESVRSETQTSHLEEWLFGSLLNTLDRGEENSLCMVGNYIGPSCVLKKLIDRVKGGELKNWEAHVYRAKINKPLWPAKWDEEALRIRREEIGSVRFASEFENNPRPEGMTLFRESWLRFYETPPENMNVFLVVDMADSIKKTADYTVIMVGGVDSAGRLYILNYDRGRFTPEGFFDRLFMRVAQYHPIRIGIESPTSKNHLRHSLKEQMAKRGLYFAYTDLPSVRDPIQRAMPAAAKMEAGKIYIRQEHEALRRELLNYPYKGAGNHDDTVDALAHLNHIAFASRELPVRRTIPEGSPLDELKKISKKHLMEDIIFRP